MTWKRNQDDFYEVTRLDTEYGMADGDGGLVECLRRPTKHAEFHGFGHVAIT